MNSPCAELHTGRQSSRLERSENHRFDELDSVRGLAALIVVFHHFFWMYFFSQTERKDPKFLLFFPLVSGHESVILFFLLSGFVLSIPYIRGRSQGYWTFLMRRIVRIYCPYVCALALAVGANAIWHGKLPLGSWSTHTWYGSPDKYSVLQSVLMLGSYDWSRYDTAFWSLVYEMRISIIFPFLFLLVRRIGVWRSTALALCCCLVLHWANVAKLQGTNVVYTLEYIAVFIVGINLAIHRQQLQAWYARLGPTAKVCLWGGSFLLYQAGHLIRNEVFRGSWMISDWHLEEWPVTIGSVGFLLIALQSPSAKRFLNSRIPAFLGRISYSLYLVHATVLFALAFMLPDTHWRLLAFCIYLPAAIGLATVFCFWIEEPFTELGRRLGRSRRTERASNVGLAAPVLQALETPDAQ